MNWVKDLKIKNFKGVISRDEIPTKLNNIPGQCFIINLDNTGNTLGSRKNNSRLCQLFR